jgi:hypothetical protein
MGTNGNVLRLRQRACPSPVVSSLFSGLFQCETPLNHFVGTTTPQPEFVSQTEANGFKPWAEIVQGTPGIAMTEWIQEAHFLARILRSQAQFLIMPARCFEFTTSFLKEIILLFLFSSRKRQSEW